MVKYDRDKKSLKTTFTIYAVTESLLEKNSWMRLQSRRIFQKKNKQKNGVWLFSICTDCSLDSSKRKHNFYKGTDCIKKFCVYLNFAHIEIIN